MVKAAFKKLFYIINVLLYFFVIGLWITIPSELTLNISTTFLALSMSAFLIIADRHYYAIVYQSFKFRKLISGLVSACLLFCILSLLNYLLYKHPKALDMSLFKVNTLAEESRKVLASLDAPLSIMVFSSKETLLDQKLMADLYKAEKNDIDIEIVDISLRPDLAGRYEITSSDMARLEYKGRDFTFYADSEVSYTNAIIKVSREKDPVVYYITGHGENNLEDMGPAGLSNLKEILEKTYFKIQGLELMTVAEIPSDASLVLLLGPRLSFSKKEITVLDDYLKAGGKLLVGLDPDLNKEKFQNLKDLLGKRGLKINRDLIIERKKFVDGSKGTVPIADAFNNKQAISQFLNGTLFFPLASSIEGGTPLVLSSAFPDSFSQKDLNKIARSPSSFDSIQDEKEIKQENRGPLSFASLYEKEDSEEKILALGNASFVTNTYTNYGIQLEFFLNAVSYLADKDQIHSFALPQRADSPIFIGTTQMGLVFYFSVIFLPLILIALAFFAYYRRMKL